VTRYYLDEVLDKADEQRQEGVERVDAITDRVERGAALLVERGAALLDEKRPDWWRDIDLERLELRSPCNCVLGQIGERVYGAATSINLYMDGLDLLRLSPFQARDFGFDSDADPFDHDLAADGETAVLAEYAALTEAWRGLIAARREQALVTA
jgi:hypothetical protein